MVVLAPWDLFPHPSPLAGEVMLRWRQNSCLWSLTPMYDLVLTSVNMKTA